MISLSLELDLNFHSSGDATHLIGDLIIPGVGFMNRHRQSELTAAIFTSDLAKPICGFYEATQQLSCNYISVELTQFDGRARGDDVMGNLTVSLLRASQVTVGKLAYRFCADS